MMNKMQAKDLEKQVDEEVRNMEELPEYRKFSNFLDSHGLQVVRRFGVLNARVLLLLQDQIAVMEEQLKNS